ncbi:MAG: FHA domain-containing protein [Myxococcales bacterium]|nr:FHA domain-containing protein [Myxococcales bacterium]
MYKLIIQDDEGKTKVVPFIREELTIGRQEGNTIRLTERNVSRRHAKLLRGQEAITIEDLDSYNGVRVNGSRIQGKAEIKEADRVQIGDYLIEVKADQPAGEIDPHTNNLETLQIPVVGDAPVPVATSGSGAVTAPNTIAAVGSDNYAEEADSASVSAPGTPAPPVSSAAEENGRLVILSTGLAGRDFELDSLAMVIGRTDENDICVNHRSISRHHAKVVRENGTYSVVDLHSANGVRVNGEEYGKVELRSGDLVDLGHVRFRYVAPGEDFLFGRDAQAFDIATEGKVGKGMWVVLLLLVAGVIAFLAINNGGDTKSDGGGDIAKEPNNTIKPDIPKVDLPDAKPDPLDVKQDPEAEFDAAQAPSSDDSAKLASYIEAALAARESDDWKSMSVEANRALGVDPGSTKAQELVQQADFEAGNQQTFDLFQAAVAGRKWAQIALHFANIDRSSVYKVQAQPDHNRMKGQYRAAQLEAAGKAAHRKKCAEISRSASRVPAQWPDVATKISRVACERAVANNKNRRPDAKPPINPENDGPPFEELVDQASAAVRDHHFGKGLTLCAQALEQKPNDQRAVLVCGIAACNLKKSAQAKKYLRRIRGASKKANLRQICIRAEVPGFVD